MIKTVLIAFIFLAVGYFIYIATYFLYFKNVTNTDNFSSVNCFVLEQKHLDSLRTSKVTMNQIESGSPMLALTLTDFLFPVHIFTSSSLNSINKNAIKGIAFDIFTDVAELQAGEYTFQNPFYEDKAHARRIANTSLEQLYKQAQITFSLTDQHTTLLKATDAGYNHGIIGINPKRPYGDATAFELDMADILGVTIERDSDNNIVSNEQTKALFRLHEALLPALQVLLQKGTIETGKYCRKTAFTPWQKQR